MIHGICGIERVPSMRRPYRTLKSPDHPTRHCVPGHDDPSRRDEAGFVDEDQGASHRIGVKSQTRPGSHRLISRSHSG